MTGATTGFQACHIVPHAKGNQYMDSFANHRNKVLDPPLNDINDPRNGILLAVQLHRPFGASVVAFLPPISRCLSTTWPSSCNPFPNIWASIHCPQSVASRFSTSMPLMLSPRSWHLTTRMRGNVWTMMTGHHLFSSTSPMVVPPSKRGEQRTRNIYYHDDDDENGDGGDDGGDGEPDVDVSGVDLKRYQQRLGIDARAARREQKKKQASNTKAADSQTPDFADIILGLWMHNARQGQRQARAMKTEKTREKVRTWLDSTKD
ncbi:hypothetical protein AX14_005652 [Amanita brunnescens Koide BX004]|nr:hypothetical protein AX14_005652 [Amanita brunnescens Koide BX004]